jgi:anti-sigma B factor antagonist
MEIKARNASADVLVIELREEHLDASNVREFREAMQLLIKNQRRVICDLEGVKFVDSSGLGALISVQRMINAAQGKFALCAMSVTVRALFDLMRMNRVFQIHVTCDEAVLAYKEAVTV